MQKKRVTVANGDGIGPEIMGGVLKIFEAAKVPLEYDFIEVGEKVYKSGHLSGIAPESWDLIKKNKVIFKAPITTPQGKGFKSLNVSMRKNLDLFSNVRPCKSFYPYVKTFYPKTNMTIVRENEEDLYAGIEYRQTEGVAQCLKLISKDGSERIARYAFEYARQNKRSKVTCMAKDNIMKITDGTFRKAFDEVSKEYPDITPEYYIIDIGAAFLATRPERFEVVVTENLYGDIVSDVVAQVLGSVGMCGSSNVGEKYAMFEAIHGSAPDIAGRRIANPSGLLSAGLMMLRHLGLNESALMIENAWLYTIESGVHTGDIKSDLTKKLVGTDDFCDAVISNLGQKPCTLKADESDNSEIKVTVKPRPQVDKVLTGVDVYVDSKLDVHSIVNSINDKVKGPLLLTLVSNRGLQVWPKSSECSLVDHYRLRFEKTDKIGVTQDELKEVSKDQVLDILRLLNQDFDVIKTENLYMFDKAPGYARGANE